MRYTVTAALPYTNGPLHIGHLAGVYIPADTYVRYLRLNGDDVLFVCGSDEHGVAISMKAKLEQCTPKEITDKYHNIVRDSFDKLGISFDNYSRTSLPIHHQTSKEIFTTLYEKGVFKALTTKQLYDTQANQFLADRFVMGTCPRCSYTEAYGDQCEQCGSTLSTNELINPISKITGSSPILKDTKHWFLPLDKYTDFLRSWLLDVKKDAFKPNVIGQIKSWLDEGLKPRPVTRDLDWGIKVPLDEAKDKVLYVWFEAPIGYISSTKEWAEREGKDWTLFWKNRDTKLVHFIGKDNIVFHSIIFPTILNALGDYILPENIPANEFLNLEGRKLSTSKNWAVWLHEYLEDFPNKQDVLRYVLLSINPETKDSDFSWADFQAKNNNELVAIFGNFINRVWVLTRQYCDNKIPSPNQLQPIDENVIETLKNAPAQIGNSIEKYRFREALQIYIDLARKGNKYLAETEPWKLKKTDMKRVDTILYIAHQISAALTVLGAPFLPQTSEKLKKAYASEGQEFSLSWKAISVSDEYIGAGHIINDLPLLFDKIDDKAVQYQKEKLEQNKLTNMETPNVPSKPNISFDDFQRLDIKIGRVLECEKVPKTDKLLVFKIDLGKGDVRTIISGIADSYQPSELIGKNVTVLSNLEPRKIRGIESQGMLLMTENESGKCILVNPERDDQIIEGAEVN